MERFVRESYMVNTTPSIVRSGFSLSFTKLMVWINWLRPSNDFDEDALQELSDSIKQYGLLQPILVQDRKDHYEIIAGERFILIFHCQKCTGMSGTDHVINDHLLYFITKLQQPDGICHCSTALGDSLGNFVPK